MPYEDRQIKLGKEMVEITSPEMAREMVNDKILRSKMTAENREELRKIGDRIEKDYDRGQF